MSRKSSASACRRSTDGSPRLRTPRNQRPSGSDIVLHRIPTSRSQLRKNGTHMITDEQKRQFGELSMDFLETLQRDGSDSNLDPIMDQWEALEKKIGRVVCYDE